MSANILPDDVLSRLLARVPLREVGLAKQVCKRWRTTFASRAYKVARRDCAEPLWLLMGGNCADTAGGGAITNRCRVFDLSMRPAAPRAWLPHPLRAAGVAMIPEVGVLLLGGGRLESLIGSTQHSSLGARSGAWLVVAEMGRPAGAMV